MVRDSETVYRHMLQSRIGSADAQLYVDWSLFLEKYRRDFEAAYLVYCEGLQNVQGEVHEKSLSEKLE